MISKKDIFKISPRRVLVGIAMLIATGILVGGLWYFLFFRVVRIPSGSMANTILPGDRVLCTNRIGTIARGEMIIFKYPPDPKVQYLMRVIGLPGETIQLRDTKVFINGKELAEARTFVELGDGRGAMKELSTEGAGDYKVYYIKRESPETQVINGAKYADQDPYQIMQGHYFVLGDSRDNSLDSRYWGSVPLQLITMKPLMIVDSNAPRGENRNFIPLR